ncbi:MAG: hypothetical protein OXC63_13385 [Aestuariivita sp.]|nr:hypothetical protein [Aestuariivita sp.]
MVQSQRFDAALMAGTAIYSETAFDARAAAGIEPTLMNVQPVKQKVFMSPKC